MFVDNKTPYGVTAFVKQIEPGEPFLTVVVTGLFDLVPEAICVAKPPDRQVEPTRAIFFADKLGNSRIRDGDAPSFKPRADCLFIGSAHAPDGRPVPFVDATIGIGPMKKTVRAVGDRHWVRDGDGSVSVVGPEPFVDMPIRNELAHGGFRSDYNKHGKGFGDLAEAPGSTLPLANIVNPSRETIPWTEDGLPAGFGALAPEMKPRSDLQGTFDEAWLYRRRPFAPEDFDMAFYNSARPDQQIDGYLAGDEELYFENLHPERQVYRSRLPGNQVRLFAHHVAEGAEPQLVEIMTVLDTCIVDMRDETVRLVWRGTIARVENEDVDQLADLLVIEEPVASPAPRETYFARLQAGIDERRPRPFDAGPTDEELAQIAALNEKAVADAAAVLRKHGADEDIVARIAAQETTEGALDIVMKYVESLSRKLPHPPE